MKTAHPYGVRCFFHHRLHFSKKLEYLCVLKFCKQKDYGY